MIMFYIYAYLFMGVMTVYILFFHTEIVDEEKRSSPKSFAAYALFWYFFWPFYGFLILDKIIEILKKIFNRK